MQHSEAVTSLLTDWTTLVQHDEHSVERLRDIYQLLSEAKELTEYNEAEEKQLLEALEACTQAKEEQDTKNRAVMVANSKLKVQYLCAVAALDALEGFEYALKGPQQPAETLDVSLTSMMEQLERKYTWSESATTTATATTAVDEIDTDTITVDPEAELDIGLESPVNPTAGNQNTNTNTNTTTIVHKKALPAGIDTSLAGETDQEQHAFLAEMQVQRETIEQTCALLQTQLEAGDRTFEVGVTRFQKLAHQLTVLKKCADIMTRAKTFYEEVVKIEGILTSSNVDLKTMATLVAQVKQTLTSERLVLGHVPRRHVYTQSALSNFQPIDVCLVASHGVPQTLAQFFHNIIGQPPLKLKHVRFRRIDLPKPIDNIAPVFSLPPELDPRRCFFLLMHKHNGYESDGYDVNKLDWKDTNLTTNFIECLPRQGKKFLVIVREQKVINHNPLPLKWLLPAAEVGQPLQLPSLYAEHNIISIGNADHDHVPTWNNTMFNNRMYRDTAQHVREWYDNGIVKSVLQQKKQ